MCWKSVKNSLRVRLRKLGFEVLKSGQYEALLSQQAALLEQLVHNKPSRRFDSKLLAEGVVFSKDRPVQLHALLTSYFKKVENPVPLHVMYTASNTEFEAVYKDVAAEFADFSVTFTPETRFRDDLINLLDKLKAAKVFFLVDDIVFINTVDMRDFCHVDPLEIIPSMRLAPYIKYSYTSNRYMPLPSDLKQKSGHCVWSWARGEEEWGYPQSVDGNLFSTLEVTAITKAVGFKAPNSYEGALGQFAYLLRKRQGRCYAKSIILNIPCNKVQDENNNRAGNLSPEALLKKWREGLVIDVDALSGFNNESCHQEVAFSFVPRHEAALKKPAAKKKKAS